jgi:hypothetical protein
MKYRVITLGACCDTTLRLQYAGLRNENSIFEWMAVFDFEDVLTIMRKIATGNPLRVISRDHALFYQDTNARTRHYKAAHILEAKAARRRDRLLQWIRESATDKPIVFLRQDANLPTTDTQIAEFCDIVRRISPDVRMMFVRLTPPSLAYMQLNPVLIPKRRELDKYLRIITGGLCVNQSNVVSHLQRPYEQSSCGCLQLPGAVS